MNALPALAAFWADLRWGWPWALALLPLAVLPLWAARRGAASAADAALPHLRHPDLHGLLQAPVRARGPLLAPLLRALALAAWVVALAQPQRLGAWVQPAAQGRDIVVLLDTSLTMSLHDVRWNGQPASRLAVAQKVFADFAAARAGDRFALIAFGSHAATLLPPTFDTRAAGQAAQLLAVGQLGQDTALGDAIALALRQVHTRLNLRPIIILYTDGGASNVGRISPADAVALARHESVRIYTVEVGSAPDPGQPYTVPAYPGPQPDLRLIAQATGGRFYFAPQPGAQQAAIRDIGALNPRLHPPPTQRATQPLLVWPLLAGVALWLLAAVADAASGLWRLRPAPNPAEAATAVSASAAQERGR